MTITDAQAVPIPGIGNPVIVVATIRNGTGRDDKLVGGSSPVATTVGLYATCACATPEPTDPVTGIEGIAPFPWWLTRANETIQLRAGVSEMVLSGLSQPLAAGQAVEVTFEFAYADPVTVQIPVVSAIGAEATPSHLPGTPEAMVEGALRSSEQALVAPPEYRSGLLSQSLGDAWVARVETDYRQWYASPKLDEMITGIHNIVGASEAGTYPIVTSVDGTSIDIPSASVNGDEATVEKATVSYVVHYAPGAWTQLDVPYSMMCYDRLHRTPDGWRVTDASCTDSGG